MRWGAALATLFGLAVAAWLLASYGVREVVGLIAQAGWGIVAVVLYHFVQVGFSALAWQTVTGPPRPGLWEFVVLRWIREGVNNLLPVAQLGGGVVSARLLNRRGLPMDAAVASALGDLTTEILTQILFTLIGLGLLMLLVGRNPVVFYGVLGVALTLPVAGVLVAGQYLGWTGPVLRWVGRLAARFGWVPSKGLGALDERIRALYRAPRRLATACFHHSASWLLGAIEVCLTLHLLGHNVSFAEGLVIESLGQAIKAAGFAIPGAIGVAEGGFVIIGALFGLGPEVSIALGIVKRLREVVLGVPALLAWQLRERSAARRERTA